MDQSTLIGVTKVTETEIAAVPEVPFTRTFSPIHHKDVIKAIKESIHAVGLEIVNAEYVLAAGGQKMFGVYDLSQGSSELCWSIGMRNSMNKSMSFGITAGTRVFVCENLCFSGEFLTFRRHTAGLDLDELAFLAYKSLRNMIPHLKTFQLWHEGLKNYSLSQADSSGLLVEIVASSVISSHKFHRFRDLYANEYDDSLWGFHEAVTEILKGSNLIKLPQKNTILNQILNRYIETFEAGREIHPLGNFYQQRSLSYR
jgi:hypothetical protein